MRKLTHTQTALLAITLTAAAVAAGQSTPGADEEYKVYTEAPRLFLRPHRLHLLRRERERRSLRWEQFQRLMAGNAAMPEPAFAGALYYRIADDQARGKQAIQWALSHPQEMRELAIVLDWCGPLLNPTQEKTLEGKLEDGLRASENATDVATVRSRVLAAIALAGSKPDLTEAVLRQTVVSWWRGGVVPRLQSGNDPIPLNQMFALLELLHAVRDNLNIELRDDATDYFKDLPTYLMLSDYPAPYPAPENLYRIPAYSGSGGPDLTAAALSRAAGLALVSYDTNALGNQYLQGWLIQDQYLLRGAFGSPYEFLWANPYQPGLSYYHVPLFFHDPHSGHLFIRSSWEDDATWFGQFDHRRQLFEAGHIRDLGPDGKTLNIRLGVATVRSGASPAPFSIDGNDPETVYLVGLKPLASYDVEIDDQELQVRRTDRAGTLELRFPVAIKTGIRVHLPKGVAANASYPTPASRKN